MEVPVGGQRPLRYRFVYDEKRGRYVKKLADERRPSFRFSNVVDLARDQAEKDKGAPLFHFLSADSKRAVLLVSCCCGLLSFFFTRVDLLIRQWKSLKNFEDQTSHSLHEYLKEILLVLIAACICYSVPASKGGGIPEVKCLLRGVHIDQYLSLNVFLAKSIGLVLMMGTNLPVGSEGPLVHICLCVSAILFGGSGKDSNWQSMSARSFLAMVALGVGVTFNSPIAGVLLGIELMMPNVYDIWAYWKCFLAAMVGTYVRLFANSLISGGRITPFLSSTYLTENALYHLEGHTSNKHITTLQSGYFVNGIANICIGLLCGVASGIFIIIHREYNKKFVQPYILGQKKRNAAKTGGFMKKLLKKKVRQTIRDSKKENDVEEDSGSPKNVDGGSKSSPRSKKLLLAAKMRKKFLGAGRGKDRHKNLRSDELHEPLLGKTKNIESEDNKNIVDIMDNSLKRVSFEGSKNNNKDSVKTANESEKVLVEKDNARTTTAMLALATLRGVRSPTMTPNKLSPEDEERNVNMDEGVSLNKVDERSRLTQQMDHNSEKYRAKNIISEEDSNFIPVNYSELIDRKNGGSQSLPNIESNGNKLRIKRRSTFARSVVEFLSLKKIKPLYNDHESEDSSEVTDEEDDDSNASIDEDDEEMVYSLSDGREEDEQFIDEENLSSSWDVSSSGTSDKENNKTQSMEESDKPLNKSQSDSSSVTGKNFLLSPRVSFQRFFDGEDEDLKKPEKINNENNFIIIADPTDVKKSENKNLHDDKTLDQKTVKQSALKPTSSPTLISSESINSPTSIKEKSSEQFQEQKKQYKISMPFIGVCIIIPKLHWIPTLPIILYCIFIPSLHSFLSTIFPVLGVPCGVFLNTFFDAYSSILKELTFNHLVLMLPVSFFITILSLSLPVPLGCISPFLVLGALFGRLAGCIYVNICLHLKDFFGWTNFLDTNDQIAFEICRCSLIGAAAFTASGLRAFSVVVSLVELVYLPGLSSQLILSSFVAMATSERICNLSILDSIVKMRALPVQPVHAPIHQTTIGKLTERDLVYIPRRCSIRHIWLLMCRGIEKWRSYSDSDSIAIKESRRLKVLGKLRQQLAIPIMQDECLIGEISYLELRSFLSKNGFFLKRKNFLHPILFDLLLKGQKFCDHFEDEGKRGMIRVMAPTIDGPVSSSPSGEAEVDQLIASERSAVVSSPISENSPSIAGTIDVGLDELLIEIERNIDLLNVLNDVERSPLILDSQTDANEAYTLLHCRKVEHAYVLANKKLVEKSGYEFLGRESSKDTTSDDALFGTGSDCKQNFLGYITMHSLLKKEKKNYF